MIWKLTLADTFELVWPYVLLKLYHIHVHLKDKVELGKVEVLAALIKNKEL